MYALILADPVLFLSTLSLRRATFGEINTGGSVKVFLSTLSLRRATDVIAEITEAQSISIHALLAESDSAASITPTASRNFYPRSPCGERQRCQALDISIKRISIHALLAESDLVSMLNRPHSKISIHALLAESDNQPGKSNKLTGVFLSTLSLRRATANSRAERQEQRISIHALLAESDPKKIGCLFRAAYFYPRSPCGERREKTVNQFCTKAISIHALLAESDTLICDVIAEITISIHALLAESDPDFCRLFMTSQKFLSTLSLRRATASMRIDTGNNIDFYPRSPCGERPAFDFMAASSLLISIHALLAESDSKSAQNNGALLHI